MSNVYKWITRTMEYPDTDTGYPLLYRPFFVLYTYGHLWFRRDGTVDDTAYHLWFRRRLCSCEYNAYTYTKTHDREDVCFACPKRGQNGLQTCIYPIIVWEVFQYDAVHSLGIAAPSSLPSRVPYAQRSSSDRSGSYSPLSMPTCIAWHKMRMCRV